ncbi:hypothetical protein GC173_01125 [bacterium]|nr:hypothetical protein [bacterium]
MLTALMGILLWGLQRDPRSQSMAAAAEREIAADDPAPTPPSYRPFQYLSSSILQDRRYLCALFGSDAPDLLLAFWADGTGGDRPHVSSFRQLFLRTDEGLDSFTEALEAEFFEGVTDQGVPERSRLVAAYTFCHLPGRGQDLVVESRFIEDQFVHHFYLADADGKLNRTRLREESLREQLLGDDWLVYRALLASARRDSGSPDLLDRFEEWTSHPVAGANAQAWVAHLGIQCGWDKSEIIRRLALCMEWAPGHVVARLVKARLRPGSGELQGAVATLKEQIPLHSDREAQTTFLISQALCALDQQAAARRLCEALLMEWPRHPGATGLLRQIDKHERGAQT